MYWHPVREDDSDKSSKIHNQHATRADYDYNQTSQRRQGHVVEAPAGRRWIGALHPSFGCRNLG